MKKNKRPGFPVLPKNPKPLMKSKDKEGEPVTPVAVAEAPKADLKPAEEKPEPVTKVPDDVMAEIRQRAHAVIKGYGNRTCACGCGVPTKSTFAPGHDAKLLSQLIEAGKREYLESKGTKANGKVAKTA